MLTSKVQETINFFPTLTSIHNRPSNIHFNSVIFNLEDCFKIPTYNSLKKIQQFSNQLILLIKFYKTLRNSESCINTLADIPSACLE